MTSKELPNAVIFEARQHIPVPLSEVTIDWSLIGGEVPDHRGKEKLQILLLAVPNEVIAQYRKIAELSKLEILALESEVFSIVRAVMNPFTRPVAPLLARPPIRQAVPQIPIRAERTPIAFTAYCPVSCPTFTFAVVLVVA